ncbi:hypothetical protein M514_12397 [Trichuris suis]|uniref:Uncharacterized protein n=1 Tax=Trichuris suis TaxID=68888 RepID=A0A085LP38_9BILA|nr:hypothetical protein M513_12397 [Trichuris suis]KFD72842.1 hypothetical protein M514_12397 [Trichuris suis]
MANHGMAFRHATCDGMQSNLFMNALPLVVVQHSAQAVFSCYCLNMLECCSYHLFTLIFPGIIRANEVFTRHEISESEGYQNYDKVQTSSAWEYVFRHSDKMSSRLDMHEELSIGMSDKRECRPLDFRRSQRRVVPMDVCSAVEQTIIPFSCSREVSSLPTLTMAKTPSTHLLKKKGILEPRLFFKKFREDLCENGEE